MPDTFLIPHLVAELLNVAKINTAHAVADI